MRSATFVELAEKHGVPLRYHPSETAANAAFADESAEPVDRSDPYRFKDFDEFLLIFAAVSRALQEPEDYARLAREFVEDALKQGVIYGELFVSPSVWTFFNPKLDVRSTMEAIVGELRTARPRATFKLLARPHPQLRPGKRDENRTRDRRHDGFRRDRYFPRRRRGAISRQAFRRSFCLARARTDCTASRMPAKPMGQAACATPLSCCMRRGSGMGFARWRTRAPLTLLAARGIPLEICPTSNRLTGAALHGHPHPYLDFDGRGCVVTIDCDDPALFETSIEREYAIVESIAGPVALERYARNAVEASFAGEHEKQAMKAQLAAAVAELRVAPRS